MSPPNPALAALLAVVSTACSSQVAPVQPVAKPAAPPVVAAMPRAPLDPKQAFESLEQRLTAARSVRILAELKSEGAVPSILRVDLRILGEQVLFEVGGEIDGRRVRGLLASNGKTITGQGGPRGSEKKLSLPSPAGLREGLLIGFTRMGLLHNAAQLVEGEPPDGTDGGARTWLTADSFKGGGTDPVTFALSVRGGSRAEATLSLDPVTGLPRERTLIVHFKRGDMRVLEEYVKVGLDDLKESEMTAGD